MSRTVLRDAALTRRGIGVIYKRLARAVIDEGLVNVAPGRERGLVRSICTHSLLAGLT